MAKRAGRADAARMGTNANRRAASVLVALAAILGFAMHAFADPAPQPFENWKTDFTRNAVALSEIRSGGPAKDGIPAIDAPKFMPVGEATGLEDRDPVIRLVVNGEARAYPLAVLMWHEIANDRIGGVPAAVTYCPLCNAAIVFDVRIGGRDLTFGTTGRLRNSDLVMYDRQTESWWQQFSGEAIIGELMGTELKMLPSRIAAWKEFREEFPAGQVLVPNDPEMRAYGRNPYRSYDSARKPFLYDGSLPAGIDPMEHVVVVRGREPPLIVSLAHVREAGAFSADGVSIVWREGVASALDTEEISRGREVGGVTVTRQSDGAELVHDVTFAFVAHAFHPNAVIIGTQ
jgi:hypothetical protein